MFRAFNAVFSDFAKSFLRSRGLTQNFWWGTQVRFLICFWLRIVHFGLVWLWYMIRQFRIHLNFLEIFVSTCGPLQGPRSTRNCGCWGALNMALPISWLEIQSYLWVYQWQAIRCKNRWRPVFVLTAHQLYRFASSYKCLISVTWHGELNRIIRHGQSATRCLATTYNKCHVVDDYVPLTELLCT